MKGNNLYSYWGIWTLARQLRRNETRVIVRQRPSSNSGSTVGSDVSYVVLSEAISRYRHSSVQFDSAVQCSDLVGECVSELEDCCGSVLVSCCCEKLKAEARR
jgi:hypothetical protein